MARKKRRVLVIGGSGGIGSAIVKKFEAMGDEVIAPNSAYIDLTRPTHNFHEKVDVVINAAGLNRPGDHSTYDIEEHLQVNVNGFYTLLTHLPQTFTHILAISSLNGTHARKGRLAYTTSKHALNGLIKSLAVELGDKGIIVNSLSPGFVQTQMTTKNNTKKKLNEIKKRIPLGRLATPEEIAEVAYFLCNQTYINGQDIVVDGGLSINLD